MNDNQPIHPTRRQLFSGLRPVRAASMGQGGEVFQPTEPLVAGPGLNPEQLPPVHQAVLSDAQVRDLFRDLSAEATDIRLSCKGVSATDPVQLLAHAAAVFFSNQVKRLQIRYRWQNKFWIDTLDRTNDGVRLVRIAHLSQD